MDNEWYLVRIIPYRTQENALAGVVLTFSNITALKASEARFRTMFQESPFGIALIDSHSGHIYEVNQRFTEIAGRSEAEMKTIDWMSITHPEDVQEDLDQMARLNAGEIPGFQMKKRYLRPDGSAVWISMTIAPLKEPDLQHKQHLCMIEDITERKQTEELLFKKNEEVRLAGEYAQSIINTVREPLIVLNGRFEVISASRAFYDTFKVTPEETQGQVLYTLGNRQWDIPRLHDLLETVLPKNRSFENFVVEHAFPGIGQKKMILNAREIIGEEGAPHLILLAMEVVPLHGDKEETGKPGMREGKKD